MGQYPACHTFLQNEWPEKFNKMVFAELFFQHQQPGETGTIR
jgi:hypothetical protein